MLPSSHAFSYSPTLSSSGFTSLCSSWSDLCRSFYPQAHWLLLWMRAGPGVCRRAWWWWLLRRVSAAQQQSNTPVSATSKEWDEYREASRVKELPREQVHLISLFFTLSLIYLSYFHIRPMPPLDISIKFIQVCYVYIHIQIHIYIYIYNLYLGDFFILSYYYCLTEYMFMLHCPRRFVVVVVDGFQ